MTAVWPPTAARARLAAVRDVVAVWLVPAFPLLFVGLPLGGERTLTVPKLVLAVAVAAWLLSLDAGALRALLRPGTVALALYAGLVVVSAATRGELWYASRESLIALFVIGVWTRPPAPAWRFWRHAMIVAWVVAAWAVVLWFRGDPLTSPATSVLGTPNVAACFLVIVVLGGLARRRYSRASGPIVGLAALLSVGAWLSALIGLVVLSRNRGVRALLAAMIYAAIAVFIAIAMPLERVTDEPAPRFWKTSVEPRLFGWRIAALEVLAHPWLGHGLGSFPSVFLAAEARQVPDEERPAWRRPASGAVLPGMPAHSDVLRIAIESGLPAAALWTLAMALLLVELRGRRLATALFVAFLVQALRDNLYMLTNVAPVIFTAIALARDEAEPDATGVPADGAAVTSASSGRTPPAVTASARRREP